MGTRTGTCDNRDALSVLFVKIRTRPVCCETIAWLSSSDSESLSDDESESEESDEGFDNARVPG